jgi:hypothetical protein
MTSTWIQEADAWLRTTPDFEMDVLSDIPIAAVVGPYDSGKSSILRRLALDTGVTPPQWLSVSAREETFSTNRLALLGMEFIDTPGLGSLSIDHATVTKDAVEQADAIVVVLPPQLIGDTPELHQILAGTMFHPDGWRWPSEAVVYVISKFDEAGVDPDDDLKAFQELVERKQAELNALLLREGFPAPGAIHVVAPDPYGLVGDAVDATPEDFDPGRGWDGMDVLRTDLENIPSRIDDLRSATEVRQRLAPLSRAMARLEEACTRLEDRCTTHKVDVDTWRQRSDDVDVLDHTSRRRLENELRAAIVGMRSTELSHDVLEERLSEAVKSWSDHVEAELGRLGSQLETDVEALRADFSLPRWEQPARRNVVDEHRHTVERLASALRGVLAMVDADPATTVLRRVKGWLETHRALSEEVVGSFLELFSILGELHADAVHQERVDAVRAQIRKDIDDIASKILKGPWDDAVGAIRSAISDTLAPLRELHDGALEDLNATRGCLDDARELVETAPLCAASSQVQGDSP